VIFGFNTDIKYGDTVYHVQSEAREHDHVLQTQVFVKGRCLGKYATSFAEEVGRPDFNEERLHDLLKVQHKHFVECARAGTIEDEIEGGAGVPKAAQAAATPPAPTPVAAVAPAAVPDPPAAEKEERISLSMADDDLAAIADASVAAERENERAAPPIPVRIPAELMSPPVVESVADPVLDSFMAELEAAEKEPPPPPLPQYRVEPAGSVIGKGVSLDCLEPIVEPDGSSVLLNVQVATDGAPTSGAQITCRITVTGGPAAYLYAETNHDGMADVRIATHALEPSTGLLIQATVHGKSASRKFMLRRE
jgi:hypothetical protein